MNSSSSLLIAEYELMTALASDVPHVLAALAWNVLEGLSI